jgi:hypothetical protein
MRRIDTEPSAQRFSKGSNALSPAQATEAAPSILGIDVRRKLYRSRRAPFWVNGSSN